jgi:stress-induced morphogen
MASETVRAALEQAFPAAHEIDVLDRTGGGDHFHVTVVSSELEGLSLLDQHRRVNEALAGLLADGTIHELRITTKGAP